MQAIDAILLLALVVGLVLWARDYKYRWQAKVKLEADTFSKGYESGKTLIKTIGFNDVWNAMEKLPDGPYKRGMCAALNEMEGPKCHRILKKR